MFVTTIHLRTDQREYLLKLVQRCGVKFAVHVRRAIDAYIEAHKKRIDVKGIARLNIKWSAKGTSVLMQSDPKGEFVRYEEHLRALATARDSWESRMLKTTKGNR